MTGMTRQENLSGDGKNCRRAGGLAGKPDKPV